MGGNAKILKKDGSVIEADKFDLLKVDRKTFFEAYVNAFKALNKGFYKKYKKYLWIDENKLIDGSVFNGSTSWIFSNKVSDEDVIKYKRFVGDVDIVVSDEIKEEVSDYLESIEGKQLTNNIEFVGVASKLSMGETTIVILKGTWGDYSCALQVDFEFLKVDNKGTVDEWSKFARSSSFEDMKKGNGIKGVLHKYLISSLIGAISTRDDIIIVTNKSTPEKYKEKKLKSLPKLLKFSVAKGARVAYELQHNEDGSVWTIDGKDVYKEIAVKDSKFANTVKEIYKLAFDRLEDNPEDEKKMWSFVGLIDLMKKYLSKEDLQLTYDRFIDFLWDKNSQEIDQNNIESDFQVKNAGFIYFKDNTNIKDSKNALKMAEKYYNELKKKYSIKENFSNYRKFKQLIRG